MTARRLRLKVDERGEVPQCVCEQAMRGGTERAAMKQGGRVRVQEIAKVDRKFPNAHLVIAG